MNANAVSKLGQEHFLRRTYSPVAVPEIHGSFESVDQAAHSRH
jgi:hypothetical protein